MDDCTALLRVAAETAGARQFTFRGRSIDPFAEPERITVAEAFAKFAGIDLLATVSGHDGDRDALAAQAEKAGVRTAADDTWGDVFSRVIVEKIDPQLGNGRATILYEYPLPQAALARAKPGSDKVAERFELYACGVELANAFAELTDPHEQRARFQAAMDEKVRIHGERYPIDEDFLDALGRMPPASGIALGFDRLAMLASGAERIEQVIWTPVVETDE
jgi:lysyl-tRNA synthetase class 2